MTTEAWHVPGFDRESGEEVYIELNEGDPIPENVQLAMPFASVCVTDGKWSPPSKPPRLTGDARPWIVGERTERIVNGRKVITEERLHTPSGQVITASWSEEL